MTGMLELPLNKDTVGALKYYNYAQKNTEMYVTPTIVAEGIILLPRNIEKLEKILDTKLTILDKTVTNPVAQKIELSQTFCLREHQITPMTTLAHNFKHTNNQILEGETGYGKTYCLPHTIAALQQKTLVLVDRTLLAEQMFCEISQNCNADVQIMSKDTNRIADINISTVQLLMKNAKLLSKLADNVGLLVLDECHICAAEVIKTIVQRVPAKYRLGLSATPTRSDGLTEMLSDIFGYTKVIAEASGNLKPHVVRVKNEDLSFIVNSMAKYKKDLGKFLIAPTLEARVVKTALKIISSKRQMLIATDIVDVQEFYKNALTSAGIVTEIINSKTKAGDRQDILQKFNDGTVQALVSFAVLEKGISIPRLDTIIHLSGAVSKEKLTQLLGRLRRVDERKQHPMFIDFMFAGKTYTANKTREETYFNLAKENKIDKLISMNSFADFASKF